MGNWTSRLQSEYFMSLRASFTGLVSDSWWSYGETPVMSHFEYHFFSRMGWLTSYVYRGSYWDSVVGNPLFRHASISIIFLPLHSWTAVPTSYLCYLISHTAGNNLIDIWPNDMYLESYRVLAIICFNGIMKTKDWVWFHRRDKCYSNTNHDIILL